MNELSYLDKLRHSTAHLLAAAVLELYPSAKPTIGPSIADGFYYDFDFGASTISEQDLKNIEKTMKKIVNTWVCFERIEVSKQDALHHWKGNEYKTELINEFSEVGKQLSLYKSGNFTDLCRGGHIDNPSVELKHFKLMSIAGAYWRGDEKNTMLTRIYGTAFDSKEALNNHLKMIEEAKKRDHRKLGKELDLFAFSDLVGKGLPLFTPKGTLLRELLNDFSQELRLKRGYKKVWIPHITKKELYQMSGHWDKFGDELFLVTSQETSDEIVMKPMNCPHHQQIFASRPRSYKDLPIKYLETTTIYRDEKAGELLGLSRVRSVTQDDAHIFCTPDQIKSIYAECIDVIREFYETIGMKYKARISFRDDTHPQNYLGDEKLWKNAQQILLEIAQEQNLDYFIGVGEAAFYGPKIDIMAYDSLGREWQLATPQLDFVQPHRFGLEYIDSDGKSQVPVMIHFALMGSLERFLSVYIEHTYGNFPLWLTPVQVKVIPISDRHHEYAEQVGKELNEAGIRFEIDDRSVSMQKKIRDAQKEKVYYMTILGDIESKSEMVNVRNREGNTRDLSIEEFVNSTVRDINSKRLE